MRIPRKGLKKAGVALLVVVSVLAAGIWVLGRESTLIYAVEHLEDRLDGRLSVSEARGSLLGDIRVREIRYRDKFGALTVGETHLRWKPVRLLIGQVAVGAMTADNVTLALAKSDEEHRKPPASLSAPISFAVTDFQIGRLVISKPEATHEIRGLRAAFAGNRDTLQGEIKSLATPWGNVKAEAKVGAKNPFPLNGQIEVTSPDPQLYSVAAKLGGNLLNVDAQIDAKARDATGSAKLGIAPFEIQPLTHLEFAARDFDPRAWAPTAPAARVSAEGHLNTDAERKLNGAFAVVNSEPGAVDDKKLPLARLSSTMEGDLQNLALHDVKLDLAQAGQFAGKGALRDGSLEATLGTRRFNLRGIKKTLHETQLAGTLALHASSETQRVRLDLTQQAYRFRFAGALAAGVARIEEAYARAGGAELTTRGTVALDTHKSFNFAGRLSNFDPSKFGKYPSHLINGRFDLKGRAEPVLQVAASVNVTDSRLNGLPATASGTFRSQRTDHPDVEMDLAMRVGDTRATAKGTIRDPAQSRSIDMKLSLAGGTLAELYRIIGVPLPPTPAYRIAGRLLQRGEVWEFRQFTGAVGSSDLSGTFIVDRGRSPQFMKADLTSKKLDLADLAGFVGAEKAAPGKVISGTPGRVLPENPYNLDKLKAADADIRFAGKQIMTERLPITEMSTHLIVKGGVLTLSPLNFGIAGGKLVSDIVLDGRASVIASRADIRVQSLQLEQLLPKLKISKASVGEMDGRIRLTARGNSIAAMLGTANGHTALLVGEGEVSDLILRLSNLDVANTLGVLMRGDRNIPIRCMVADLAFENGIMHPQQFIFDTAHTTLVGSGKANFADETLDLRLVAKPKDASLLSLRGPIVIGGTFADPSVLPDMKQLTARGAAAVVLGTIATPLAALVPFIQFGKADAVDCGPLMQAAKQAIHKPSPHIAAH